MDKPITFATGLGPRAYYNEFDPKMAAWLRENIKAGLIADGYVDERSIVDVQPEDVQGFTQCHWFAGLGTWSYAARLAGWSDARRLWTGSAPCQPWSAAGKRKGHDDPRDLWPHLFRLIRACRPDVVMGEQVAGKVGYLWLDRVQLDLESEGYASGAVDIPALAVDAPHIRNRIYWVGRRPVALGDSYDQREQQCQGHVGEVRRRLGDTDAGPVGLAHSNGGGCAGRPEESIGRQVQRIAFERTDEQSNGEPVGLADSQGVGGGAGFCQTGQVVDRPILTNSNGPVDLVDSTGVRRREGVAESDVQRRGTAITGTDAREQLRRGREPVTQGDSFGSGLERQCWNGYRDRGWQSETRPVASSNGTFWGRHDVIQCFDGKARRSKPNISSVVDGLAEFISISGGTCFREIEEEIESYAKRQNVGSGQVLSEVWCSVFSTQANGQTLCGLAEQDRVREPEILLSFLCELIRRQNGSRCTYPSDKETWEILRGMWTSEIPPCPPLGQKYLQQRSFQYSDSLQALSSLLAQHARQTWEAGWSSYAPDMAFLKTGVKARILKWSGLGNAIVPPLAAEVIKALMDVMEIEADINRVRANHG